MKYYMSTYINRFYNKHKVTFATALLLLSIAARWEYVMAGSLIYIFGLVALEGNE